MLYRFISGDFPISIGLYAVAWLWARGHYSLLKDVWRGDTPAWNLVGRVTLGALALLPLWVAAADNWRQLLAYTLSARERWTSDPFETGATADPLRAVSLALLVVAIGGVAIVYARHRGGIGLALFSLVLGIAYFYFLDPIRMRLDVLMRQSEDALNHPEALGVSFIVFWSLGLYALIVSLIFALGTVLFTIAAVPARLVYWLLTRGRNEHDDEVLRVYQRTAQTLHATATAAGEPRAGERLPGHDTDAKG